MTPRDAWIFLTLRPLRQEFSWVLPWVSTIWFRITWDQRSAAVSYLPVWMARMTCCTCIMRIRIVSIRIYQLWVLKCCSVTLTKWVATPLKQVRSQMARGQLWFWVALLKRDSSHTHRSRCCNGYNCCERAVLLWATAVAPSTGPKFGSKWTSKVYQQPTHGYIVSFIPQHAEWGKTFDAG